jgi:hypothetical protein
MDGDPYTDSSPLGAEKEGLDTLEAPGGRGGVVSTHEPSTKWRPVMPAMAAPLAADKLGAWEAWIAELTGTRKDEFDEMNARHELTEHRAYLQPTPDGNYLVLVIHEGPGGDDFIPNLASSDNAFDQWFAASIVDLHAMDMSGPPPPLATRRL